ncbi:MAG: hypothetical protein WCG27_02455, partial [Pseudomonadota bacterium]
LCKQYGVQLIVSENTLKALPQDKRDEFVFRPLDRVKVKGKDKAVAIFEGLHSFHPFYRDREALKSYIEAYQLYLSRDFAQAGTLLSEILGKYPHDLPSQKIKENCDNLIQHPPSSDWDGTAVYKTK